MNLYGNLRNWATHQGQVDPSMWNSMASSVPQPHGMGGFVSGCDPTLQFVQQQQQAQSQAQIDLLREQNFLLKQHITTQAAFHIQQLQTIQIHPSPPQPHHSSTTQSSSTIPSTEPPPSNSKDISSPDTSALLQKMSEEIAEKLTSSVRDLRDEDNQRRTEDLRALCERQLPESTQPPAPTPPAATPAIGASLPPSSMLPPPIPAPPPLHPSTSPTTPARTMPAHPPVTSCPCQPHGDLSGPPPLLISSQVPLTRSSKSHHHRRERPRSPSRPPQHRHRDPQPPRRDPRSRRHRASCSSRSRSRSCRPDKRPISPVPSTPQEALFSSTSSSSAFFICLPSTSSLIFHCSAALHFTSFPVSSDNIVLQANTPISTLLSDHSTAHSLVFYAIFLGP